jgi:hypothetical protein
MAALDKRSRTATGLLRPEMTMSSPEVVVAVATPLTKLATQDLRVPGVGEAPQGRGRGVEVVAVGVRALA